MAVKAFPSAEGFGAAETTHARGGSVIFVDNLNDSGPGSLRAAFEAAYPRYIIPRIGGAVALNSNILIKNPYFYYAGQAAPGGGLLVRNYELIIQTYEGVIRFYRGRPGMGAVPPTGRDTHGLMIYGGTGPKYNLVIDHSDFSWATDQNGPDIYAWAYNVTIQWCAIGEGTQTGNGDPAKPNHDKGNILGAEPWMWPSSAGDPTNILTVSEHHCWYHSTEDRTPLLSIVPIRSGPVYGNPALLADIRNILIFNNPNNAIKIKDQFYSQSDYNAWVAGTSAPRGSIWANVIGCLMIPGAGPSLNDPGNDLIQTGPSSRIHARNNRGYKNKLGSGIPPFDGLNDDCALSPSRWTGEVVSPSYVQPGAWDPVATGVHVASEFACPPVTTHDVDELLSVILANAGCIKPMRDSVLERWISEVNTAGGNVSITHSDYPTLAAGTYPTHSQPDGIADSWKIAQGLSTSVDYTGVTAANGYDVIENYLNYLAGDDVDIAAIHAGPAYIPMMKNEADELAGLSVSGEGIIKSTLLFKNATVTGASAGSGAATFE